MKKVLLILFAAIFLFTGAGELYASDGDVEDLERMHPAKREMEWFCPWCGGNGPSKQTGMHMMRGQEQDTTRGYYCRQRQLKEPLSQQEAKRLMENYADRNPNLRVGEIAEKDDLYVGRIVTRDGSLVEKVVVNRRTGWMRVEY